MVNCGEALNAGNHRICLCISSKIYYLCIKRIIMEDNKGQKLNIDLPADKAEGIYSNLAIITHSPSEFVVDFIRMMPGMPQAKVQSRIILTPQHAKRLMKALEDNINKFESMHGPIKVTPGPQNMMPMNFGGPKGMA